MAHIVTSGGYPWNADPDVTDAWLADSKYLDTTGSVGIINPSKGIIPLIQSTGANKGAYSATLGSKNKGQITLDGANDHYTGDALAPKVSNSGPYTMIVSLQLVTVVASATPFGFGATGSADHINLFQVEPITTPAKLNTAYYDNVGNIRTSTSDYVATTAHIVATLINASVTSGPGAFVMRINAAARTVITLTTPASPGIGDADFTKFTLGAWRGTSPIQFCNMKWRGMVFAPRELSPAKYRSYENFFLAEAA